MSIQDYPDLLYRGQMLDIARNYTTVDNLKKLIDMLSSYKLNVLQFHFSDDEGWRLEIPGLEELTAIGSRRGHTTDEKTGCIRLMMVDMIRMPQHQEMVIIPGRNLLIYYDMRRKDMCR